MKRFVTVVVAAGLLASGCGKDPKTLVFTDKNRDEVVKQVAEAKTLSAEEKQLVVAYLVRAELATGLGAAFGENASKPTTPFGKSVGQIIEEQRAYAAEESAREEKAKKLAAEAKSHEDARLTELRKAVLLTVFDLAPEGVDFMPGTRLKIAYENTSGKDIRAFEGRVVLRDVLGAELADESFKSTDTLKAGEKRQGTVLASGFAAYGLRGKKIADVKVEWRPSTILFADGTEIKLEEK